MIWLGAAVKQSPTLAEVDPLSIVDVVVAEASGELSQTSARGDPAVAESLVPPSVHPSRVELSPTVSPAGDSPPRGSSPTETLLRRTADGQPADPTAPRGRISRKARLLLRRRGLPSPHKGVGRRLFGSSSPQSAAEEPRHRSPTLPATTLDLSADCSRSPSVEGRPYKGHADLPPVRPADLPSPFLAADELWAPMHPVVKQATVSSGYQGRMHKLVHTSLTRQVSPACQRSPAHKHSSAEAAPVKVRHARQRSPARPRSSDLGAVGKIPDRSRDFTSPSSFQANPPLVTPPRDRSIPFPPEGVSDSTAVNQQPWFGSLVRAVMQAFKPVLSELGHKSVAASTPLKRKRGVSNVVTSLRAKPTPRKSLKASSPPPPQTFTPSPLDEDFPSSGELREVRRSPFSPMREIPPRAGKSSRVWVEKSLPPSLLESCILPRRESKDSKTVPKSSSRLRPDPAKHLENVHESPQEEPLGTGDFAASPSGGELQESEHAFWQVLTLMRNLNGFADPEIPLVRAKTRSWTESLGLKTPKGSAALPWSQGVKSARDKVKSPALQACLLQPIQRWQQTPPTSSCPEEVL
ncbi:proline-rich protein 36-like [Palaemon carinicauda]|uniref:proline-rich protein 36-like n=1 Tax=Palaemon carinicauda TaxID=392227 RepID=UPI0035B60291